MTHNEYEKRIEKLDTEIEELMQKREQILQSWLISFQAEDKENIRCEYERRTHTLYLTDGRFKMEVAHIYENEVTEDLKDFYKNLDQAIQLYNIVNKHDLTKWQKNLVYAKAVEVREHILGF